MSYSITLINSGNTYSTSSNSFFRNYEVFDVDNNVISNDFILDDENNSISFSLIIKNNFSKKQLQPNIQKFFINIAPSILFNEDVKFSSKLLLNVSVNGNIYSVSSDYISSTTDAIIGIIFTDSTEFIQGYLNDPILNTKFILIPYVIENEGAAYINFTFTLIEEFSTSLRRKYPRFDQILYDLSKVYISAIEQNDNISLSSLYNSNLNNYNYLLLERSVLNQSNIKVDIDNYLFFILNLNGTRYTFNINALDSFVLNSNYNSLCDLLLNSSLNGFIHTSVNIVNISNSFQAFTVPATFPIDFIKYVENVLKLVIIDILRPYYINIPYTPINQLQNAIKVSKTLNILLQNLYDNTAKSKLFPGYVYSSNPSDIIDDLTRRKLYNLLFIYANFYIQFLIKSALKGALPSTSYQEITDLISFLNDTGHLNYYNENINKINVISKEELQYTDIYILFVLLPVLILYSSSGKNIFYSESDLVSMINNHYVLYREITERLGLVNLDIDINADTINFPINLDKNFLLKETILLGILDQLSTLSIGIFDSDKFSSLRIRDHYANYVNVLYNIFANISDEIILVNKLAPNNYTYVQSLLDLNVKLVNGLIFVQNLNRKFQQNSISIKFIFNDTLF